VTGAVALWTAGLPLLVLAPIAAAALVAAERARSARRLRVVGAREHRALGAARPWVRPALAAGGLLCALAALLRPAWGASAESVEQRGADVVVCLDVSRSMLAQDQAPSRLDIRQLRHHGSPPVPIRSRPDACGVRADRVARPMASRSRSAWPWRT